MGSVRNMQRFFLIFFTATILLAGIFAVAQPVDAAPWQLVPECGDGGCNVCDAIGVGINITKIMLGTLGSAALLMFVYGGVLMAISRGHTDQVQKGKDALTNAVKGVIIVLASWVVINYGLAIMLGSKDVSKPATIFVGQWATVACSGSGNDSVCLNKSKGTTCGTNLNGTVNSVCDGNGNCISKCENDYGTQGFSCRSQSQCQAASIKPEICPGGNDMVCCLP